MAEPSLPLTGGCGCGAVRFEVDASRSRPRTTATAPAASGEPARRRRRTGAPCRGRSTLIAGEEHLRSWAPEGGAEKVFCGLCGSAVFSRTAGDPPVIGVRLGADRRRPRDRAAVAPVRRLRRELGGDPGRRAPALPRRRSEAPSGLAQSSARSRAPSSSCFLGGRSRRRLRSGETAAPERESLALLPSGPDAVRMLPVRGTRPSTPRARNLIPLKPPSDGVRSRWSGCRVQGTANSPPSATGREAV